MFVFRERLVAAGFTSLTIAICMASCDRFDDDDIGRDAALNEKIVTQISYSVAVPQNHLIDENFLAGTANRASRITCLDEDGASPQDLFCPVSFRQASTKRYVPDNEIVEGRIAAAALIDQQRATIVVAREFNIVNNSDVGAWALANPETDLNEAMRTSLMGRLTLGIIIDGSTFTRLDAAGRRNEFLKQRFGELVAHELFHLVGPDDHARVAECERFETFMCRGYNYDEDAPAQQQYKVSQDRCRVLGEGRFRGVPGVEVNRDELTVAQCYRR